MYEVARYEVSRDSDGNELEGDEFYKLHLPSKIPVKEFWSVLVFNAQSHLLIKNEMPWPSVNAIQKELVIFEDGSIEIYFGPKAPVDKKINWIQTIPKQKWYMVLNLYEPLEPWFDETWKPGNIEKLYINQEISKNEKKEF